MNTMLRAHLGRSPCAPLIIAAALSGQALAGKGVSPDEALLPVTAVQIRLDLERGEVITGIRTPFGITPVRPAEFVSRQFDWESQRATQRAPRAIYDLDFSTTIDTDPEASDPVEAAILLNRGTAQLSPGPDAFVFIKNNTVAGVRVAPLIRDANGKLSKGPEVQLDSAGALAPVTVGGQKLFGFAVDLNMWAERGYVPTNGAVMGLVVSHDGAPGAGALVIAEIVAGDAPLFSGGPNGAGGGGGSPLALGLGGGGGISGNAGGRDTPTPPPDTDGEEEVPSPGAGLVLGLGLAAAAARRRRR
jgi:MYXO-CTERM domain-containing protein